jgi:hypothetical protein|nr:MAG TPA: hypothetical protein [Caudoviricetes sp.]
MNHRQQVAAMHARELAKAKQQLLLKVNQYIQEVRADGGNAKVVPQLQRLISLGSYRLRDVQKMREIASDPKKVQDYVYAVNASGEPISGEKAAERYARYATSPIYREPAKEVDMMVDNVATTVEQTFVDLNAYQQFESFLHDVLSSPENTIGDSWWHIAHHDWDSPDYRGDRNYGKVEMVKQNMDNILEMRSALKNLIEKEGVHEAAKRIADNYAKLQEASIIASIGYKEAAGSAIQDVLLILLPSDRQPGSIRHRMSDMQDVYEGQYDYNDYGE